MGVGLQPAWAKDVTEPPYTKSSGTGNESGGAASGLDNAVDNTLTVCGEANMNFAYGGYAEQGKAIHNTLNLTGGTVGCVMGGYSKNNDVTGNVTNMTGGFVRENVVSAFTENGAAGQEGAGNVVNLINVPDGSFAAHTWIRGGLSSAGNADYNSVFVTNTISLVKSSSESDEGGLNPYGGYLVSGGAVHNTVTIRNSKLSSVDARGAYSGGGAGDLNYNMVNIIDSTIGLDSSNPVIIMGAMTGGTGAMDYNSVVIDHSNTGSKIIRAADRSFDVTGTEKFNYIEAKNGSTVGQLNAAYERYGNIRNNTVSVKNSQVTREIIAARVSKHGNVTDNYVMATDSTVATEVYGGMAARGYAAGNSVLLDGTTTVGQTAYGGDSFVYDEGTVGAAGNRVTVTENASVPTVYGGYAGSKTTINGTVYTGSAAAVGNSVIYDSLAGQAGIAVYGGYSKAGNAGQKDPVTLDGVIYQGGNTVTAAGNSTFQRITGGYAAKDSAGKGGNADNNTVSLDGAGGAVAQLIYGGNSLKGSANDNIVSVSNITRDTPAVDPAAAESNILVGGSGFTSATGNTVTISASKLTNQGNVYGGQGGSRANGNTLNVINSTLSGAAAVAGGKSNALTETDAEGSTTNPSANGNKVIFSGSTLSADNLYGGWLAAPDLNSDSNFYSAEQAAATGTADGNQFAVSSGITVKEAIGGKNEIGGSASKNIVTVDDGTIEENLVGGLTQSGAASGNTLTLNGGTFGTSVNSSETSNLLAGGYTASGPAADNTVTIAGGILGNMLSLYGGYSTTESTGNTLNLYTKDNTVKNLGYFQTLNFYVPKGTKAGETMLEVTGNADVHGAAIYAGVEDTTQLNPGEVINLIHDGNNEINTTGTSYAMMDGKDIVTDAAFLQRKAYIKKQDANTIVLYVPTDSQPILHPGTEIIADGQTNASSTVSGGSDAAVTDGLQAALTAWAESHEAARLREDDHAALSMTGSPYISSPAGMSLRQGPVMAAASPLDAADAKNANVTLSAEEIAEREEREVEAKFTPYVMLGGHNLRYNSSSTVDTNGFNGELGFVKRVFKKDYADTIMPFIEYGTGSYTSYKNGSRGDGSQRYVGAGILLRRDHDNGLHYEGLVRVGRLMGDYAGSIGGYRTTYNSSANYFAAHAGLGKIFRQDSNDYNLYGKFFYSHLGGDSVTLRSSLGSADYSLSSVNSYWTRLGFRWTKHLDEDTTSFYAGLGWDYEFDGKATARYRDYTTPDASMKGSSEFLELGWQSKVTKENPWGADVRITGWHGVKQGFTYGVTITRRM